MTANSVSVHLSVAVRFGQVRASLDFANESQHEVFIEKYNACANGQIENNVFEIRSNEHTLDYKGPLFKRRRPVREDYVSISRGRKFSTQVDLAKAYDFPRGNHDYTATYSAVISYLDRDGIWTLTSNAVRFSF